MHATAVLLRKTRSLTSSLKQAEQIPEIHIKHLPIVLFDIKNMELINYNKKRK